LQINTLGDLDDRNAYRGALVEYYTPLVDQLCDDCKRRLELNPLRLLDCKKDARLVDAAPLLQDLLKPESVEFFDGVLAALDAAKIPYTRNQRLVRGLDYYAHTTFEWWHTSLQGAQNALGGGGRYDGLAEVLGFPATPGVGYAIGCERTLNVARELGVVPPAPGACDVVVCSLALEQGLDAASLARELRGTGRRVVLDASKRKLDKKLRDADRLGARWAVIIGEREVNEGTVSLRDMSVGAAETVSRDSLGTKLLEAT
jgi:histidyl-tRNA synthetase